MKIPIVPGLLLCAAIIVVPWTYTLNFACILLTLAAFKLLLQKVEISKIDESPENRDATVTIAAPLRDTQLLERLDDAQRMVERFNRVQPGMQNRLDNILRYEENMQQRHQGFVTNFPAWRRSRMSTVKEVKKLRENLDSVCVVANSVKAGGNILGIAGGGGCMLAAAVPGVAPAAAFFTVLKIVGDVIVPTTTLIENALTEDYIGDVKSVFRRDAEQSERIVEYLGFSTALDRHFEQVFHCSFRTSPLEEFAKNINDHIEGLQHMGAAIEIGRHVQRGGEIFNERNAQRIRNVCGNMQRIRNSFTNPRLFRICTSAVQIVAAINGFGYVDSYASGLALLAIKHGLKYFDINLNENMGLTVQCLNEIPNITMHALSLNSALKKALEGKSEYSAPMKGLEEQLTLELNILTRRFENGGNVLGQR